MMSNVRDVSLGLGQAHSQAVAKMMMILLVWKMKQVSIGEILPEEEVPSPMQTAVLVGASSKSDFVGVPKGMQLLLLPLSPVDILLTAGAPLPRLLGLVGGPAVEIIFVF